MELLVTNDDGIESPFLHELVRALLAQGHDVAVVAPAHEQSWIGAAKSRHRALRSVNADFGLKCPSWTVDGTPSDCVNIALAHLLPRMPDAVISGINMGFNASLGLMMASGTIGGAWEGVTHGLRALAVSQNVPKEMFDELKARPPRLAPALHRTLAFTADHIARHAQGWLEMTEPRQFILHNVNYPFPCHAGTPVERTVPARTFVPKLFMPREDDGMYQFVFSHGEEVPLDPKCGYTTDRDCLRRGSISHSVLDYTRVGVVAP